MYLAYVLADIGYNLQEWNFGTALLVIFCQAGHSV
jgi:hypothetical protein